MELKNQIGIETRYGFRTFELYEGDLTALGRTVDLVAVSAFRGSYAPTRGTVIGALLHKRQLDVAALAQAPEYDFRGALGVWISKPLKNREFRRLACVEIVGTPLAPEEALENLFVGVAVLEAKNIPITSLALPVLGAGSQALDPAKVMRALIPAAKAALERSPFLSRILFVEIDSGRVTQLSAAMDETLGRSRVHLPKGPLLESLRADILTSMTAHRELVPVGHQSLLDETRRILKQETARSFEIGILARRLVEFVVDEMLGRKKTSTNLPDKIDRLGDLGVAPWIRGYMHTLRVLGNDEAHEKNRAGRTPAFASEDDLAICLFSMHRIWNFWCRYKLERAGRTGVTPAA
ncbi:MAG TPA: DUF4145 domain-containing protein [Gemmatimonadales bacterium]|nr:DUF4145 domain-containing protein [Gemmatimonadales bacterium]